MSCIPYAVLYLVATFDDTCPLLGPGSSQPVCSHHYSLESYAEKSMYTSTPLFESHAGKARTPSPKSFPRFMPVKPIRFRLNPLRKLCQKFPAHFHIHLEVMPGNPYTHPHSLGS